MSSQIMKPHVAVLPSPGLGHITPLLEFSKRLVTLHGFHVTFLNITTTEPSPAQDGLLHPSNLPLGLHVIDLPPVDVSATVPPGALILANISLVVRQSLRSLPAVLAGLDNKPKALVIDLFCTDAFELCKPLSIPVYTFFTASAKFLAFMLFFPTLDREVVPELVDPLQIPGSPSVRVSDLLGLTLDVESDDYRWFILHMSRLKLAAGVLANTWEDLEPVQLGAVRHHPFFLQLPSPPIYPIGPVIKEDEPDTVSKNECVAWLDKQPPGTVVFVALGSAGTLTAVQLRELALGLELSQQRFLWVVKKPSDAFTVDAFFNAGSNAEDPKAYLPEGFLERTEGSGMVVGSWAPQVAVLRHPATGAFVSHCGWNSTLESLTNGVPMIAWPLYAEQKMNAAALVEEVGVAVKAEQAEAGVVGRREVERVVKMVMEGEEGKVLRRRAKELKESAAKALGVGGSSSESLSRVAKQWRFGN